MATDTKLILVDQIEPLILTVRGQKVMLDSDLAALYGVTTKALNQAVKRNRHRFPADFMFQLTPEEKTEEVANCDRIARRAPNAVAICDRIETQCSVSTVRLHRARRDHGGQCPQQPAR